MDEETRAKLRELAEWFDAHAAHVLKAAAGDEHPHARELAAHGAECYSYCALMLRAELGDCEPPGVLSIPAPGYVPPSEESRSSTRLGMRPMESLSSFDPSLLRLIEQHARQMRDLLRPLLVRRQES